MRVLVQLGAARPADQGALAPLPAALLAALRREGIAAEVSREIIPDTDRYDLVHLLAEPPIDRAFRQFIHARRLGRPLAVSFRDGSHTTPAPRDQDPAQRYATALRDFMLRGADGVLPLAVAEHAPDAPGGSAEHGRAALSVPLLAPDAGKALRERYRAILEERGTMTSSDEATRAHQWLPDLAPEEYGKHLEDLVQLQLEVIAYRDAEYEQLRRQLDAMADRGGPGHGALQDEYERLGEWSRDLAARHEALQADHERQGRWAADLEAQVRAAGRVGLRARLARLRRRG